MLTPGFSFSIRDDGGDTRAAVGRRGWGTAVFPEVFHPGGETGV